VCVERVSAHASWAPAVFIAVVVSVVFVWLRLLVLVVGTRRQPTAASRGQLGNASSPNYIDRDRSARWTRVNWVPPVEGSQDKACA
jgi:hypothetical protein